MTLDLYPLPLDQDEGRLIMATELERIANNFKDLEYKWPQFVGQERSTATNYFKCSVCRHQAELLPFEAIVFQSPDKAHFSLEIHKRLHSFLNGAF